MIRGSIICYRCGGENHMAPECVATETVDGDPIDPDSKARPYKPTQANTHVATCNTQYTDSDAVEDDESEEFDFDFDDVLDDECYQVGYYFNQIASTYVEDMRGNRRYCLNMNDAKGRLKMFWILLDNQSTVHIFWNTMFLVNVRKTKRRLELHTNAGSVTINEIGELPGVGTVWVHREGIANILSFHALQETNNFEIDYTSRIDKTTGRRNKAFQVETPHGVKRSFIPDGRGLYYLNCEEYFGASKPNVAFGPVITTTEATTDDARSTTGRVLLNDSIETIRGNKERFTNRDVRKAEALRRFQHIAGHPSDATLIHMATRNVIKDVPFAPRDVKMARKILGPSIYGIKGKRTERKKESVELNALVPIPRSIEERYKDVILAADVVHVNRIPMLTTVSRALHYGTVGAIPSMKIKTLNQFISNVVRAYNVRGFKVRVLAVDKQFESLKTNPPCEDMTVNVVSRQEHVPEIERFIRVMKERARAMFSMLPFEKIPKKMTVAMMETVVHYINAFPWVHGVSQDLSPLTIVEGRVLSYSKDFPVIFGEYAQVFEGTDNTLNPRTIGAIALGPSGNIQGGVKFYSLSSGEYLDRATGDYKILPMPNEVITRVHRMARRSRSGLTFGDRNNNDEPDPTDDDMGDEDYVPEPKADTISIEDEAPQHDMDCDTESVASSTSESSATNRNEDPEEEITGVPSGNDDADEQITGVPDESDEESAEVDDHVDDESTGVDEESQTMSVNEDSSEEEEDTTMEGGYRTSSGREVRGTQDPDYVYTQSTDAVKVTHLQFFQSATKIKRINPSEYQNFINALEYIDHTQKNYDLVNDYAMSQMSIQEGLRVHGDKGKASIMKEIHNLVSRECFGEVEQESLTAEQKRNALPILMFMLVKRNGTLKSRGCADGRPQRLWTDKRDVSSPTPATESLKYVLATIASEGRDVASFDLPGQFLQTEMDELLFLKITGALALLMMEYDKNKWKKHIRRERGKPVIYVKCKKAIYGTLNAAILAYKKLTRNFQEWGLEMNPYEPCVWNKMVNGSQLTVIFHVDDGLVSHKDPSCVSDFLKKLDTVYGKIDPLTIERGKVHEYLGMTLDFSKDGEVMITMYDYIQKVIDKLPKEMIGERATAAPEYLFKTKEREEVELLDKDRKETFHTLTATALYLAMRGRADLQLATGFLCTRVKDPDEHDWKKLKHMMQYLQATAHLPSIIGKDGQGTRIYIDGAHAVHANMRGHAGMFVTEGKGGIINSSTKMKLNTISSTETEIVAVGEKLPKCVWFRLFRMAQDGCSKEDTLMQDNQSAILLENNGRKSAGKGSKHIDIRYFFITDRINKRHITVEYCPTEEMISDFFTKPLQGALFHKFRDAILGINGEDFVKYKEKYFEILEKYKKINEEYDRQRKEQENV